MKITFIAEIDFANVLTEYSYCLNKHSDIQSRTVCIRPHGFNYKIQHDYDLSKINETELNEVYDWITTSDVIVFGEESAGMYQILQRISTIINYDILSSGKKLIIWHPGSNYRNSSTYYNNHPLRDKIYKHLYAIDLYRLSPKNNNDFPIMPYHYIDFDINKYIDIFKKKLQIYPRTILHIPSKTTTKGTTSINATIQKLQLPHHELNYKMLTGIPYMDVIVEKEKSLFYIDQFAPELTGGIGIAAFEGIIHSNLVFCSTNFVNDALSIITKQHMLPVIDMGTTVSSMERVLEHHIQLSDQELIDLAIEKGKWMEKYYSINFIVTHFKEIVTK